jgi:hypothetical protein
LELWKKKKEEEMAAKAKLYRVPNVKKKDKKQLMKVCTTCEKEYPATLDHFHKSSYKGHKDKLKPQCKGCCRQQVADRKKGIYKREVYKHKKEEQQPQFIDDGADWVAKEHQVFFKDDVVAMATSPYWANRIVQARQASREAISDKKIVHTIKTLVNKELNEQLQAKDDEISRLRAIVAHSAPPTEEEKKPLHEIKRNLQMDRDVRLDNNQVNYLLRENNYDAKDVAELIGVTEAHFRQCLTNGHLLKMGQVVKMADLFEVDVATLVARVDKSRIPVVE